MSSIVPSGDATREERVADHHDALEEALEAVRAEARVMRDAAFLAYGALVVLVGISRDTMVNAAGAGDLIARLESVLFPEEPEAELPVTKATLEKAKEAHKRYFRPGEPE